MSLAPTTFYDILPNDYLSMTLMGQVVDNKSGMVPGGSYTFPPPGEGLAPTYPMYDGIPNFQTTPSFPNSSSVESPASWEEMLSQSSSSSLLQTPPPLPSSSSIELPTSWDPSWCQLPVDPIPFFFPPTPSLPSTSKLEFPITFNLTCSQSSAIPPPDLSHLDFDSDSEEEEEPRKFTGPLRRGRGRAGQHAGHPYTRPPGTGYNAMMASLPGVLQEKVKSEYDCCARIDKKDSSSNMKHWFSNNHFRSAVGEESFHLQPMFVCPSFIAMMLGCRSAKGGRYDSSDRHCGNCQTFEHFAKKSLEKGMVLAPLLLTRGEFEAIRDFRKQALPGQRCYSAQVQSAVFKLLKMMITSQVSIKGKGKGEA